eukprot:s2906_g6.t1
MAFAPILSGSPEERLRKLGEQFTLDRVVLEALIKEKIQDLEEFRFFFDCETKVEKWMSKLSLGEEANIQAARVRRAWNAVSLYYKNFEMDRSKVSTTDLDSLLDDSELRTHKQNSWVRYKLRFPTEQYPSDATVSRVTRELDKRMLCVTSVWKVKSLQWQLLTTSKKRKLGDGLFTEEPELEEPGPKDVEHYLERLHTLMLAYALAGSSRLSGAPPAKDEDVMGSDTTKFVGAPLDILLKYHSRAKRVVMQLAPGKRLSWLQTKDIEERSEWVSKYRESTRTLGTIIKETYEARDAHWVVVASTESPSVAAPMAQSGAPESPVSHFPDGPEGQWQGGGQDYARWHSALPSFSAGQLQAQGCFVSQSAHKCGVVTKGQRICNSANHGASTCLGEEPLGSHPFPPLPPPGGSDPPLFADLMCGPNAPLSQAFLFCGWRTMQVDWLLDPSHARLHVILLPRLWIAQPSPELVKLPGSLKMGENPGPLRSDRYPEGFSALSSRDQHRAADEQRGALRENPARTLHWELPHKKAMMASGCWFDTDYSACVFNPARAKSQRLRHNIQAIAGWTNLQCHHIHAEDEWTPFTHEGVRVYPSKEEAEYSACLAFSIAVAASWWAVRTACCSGGKLTAVLQDGALPPEAIYVGQGHSSHRIPKTKWASPFTPGHNVSLDEWLPKYVEWVSRNLWSAWPELEGKLLVCDCQHDGQCEADLLAGMVFDALRPGADPPLSKVVLTPRAATPSRRVRLAARGLASLTLPKPVWSIAQEEVILAFRKLFPEDWFLGFRLSWDGPLAPLEAPPRFRLRQRHAEGQQAGALSHKAALPPLLSFGLAMDDHFHQAEGLLQRPTPLDMPPLVDEDLRYAASSQPTGT